MRVPVRHVTGRKLLIASIGVAAVSYVACTSGSSGNLMPPQGIDASTDARADAPATSGNLMPPDSGFGADTGSDTGAGDAPSD